MAVIKNMMKDLGWQAKAICPEDAKAMLQQTWLYGLMPERSFAATTPQGMGMMKFLAMGTCKVYAFHLGDLVEHQTSVGLDFKDTSSILHFSEDDLQAMVKKNRLFYHATMEAGTGIYVPCGYILAERPEESVLVYGVRKSFCLRGDSEAYSSVCSFKKAKEDTARYESMLLSIQEAEGIAS